MRWRNNKEPRGDNHMSHSVYYTIKFCQGNSKWFVYRKIEAAKTAIFGQNDAILQPAEYPRLISLYFCRARKVSGLGRFVVKPSLRFGGFQDG